MLNDQVPPMHVALRTVSAAEVALTIGGAVMKNISIPRGDYVEVDLAFTREGVPMDVEDAFIYFTAKRSYADEDSEAIIKYGTANTGQSGITTLPASEGNQGRAKLGILPAATISLARGTMTVLFFDIQVQELAISPPETAALGELYVIPTVTDSFYS